MPEHWVLERLYSLANSQLGYFTTAQAGELGVDRRYLTHHLRSGNIERVRRGIYRLRNYPIHRFEDVMVATLWVGAGAAASHTTALSIYGLAGAMPPVIHITLDRRFRGTSDGVRVHRAPLARGDITTREGIPITTPMRTLLDIAGDPSTVIAAVEQAVERGLVRPRQILEIAARYPHLAKDLSRLGSW